MTEDSLATGAAVADPATDTQDELDADTAENTQPAQQSTEELENRYRNLQSWATKRERELQDQILAEREQREAETVDPTDPLAVERAKLARQQRELEEREALVSAKAEYPPVLISAMDAFERATKLDPSPKGRVKAMDAAIRTFVQTITAEAGTPEPKAKESPRREAVKPRVDTSRSAAPEPAAFDDKNAGTGRDALAAMIRGKFHFEPKEPRKRV